MTNSSQHTFHIPVLGLAYSIDSPIKVARFGISSVISIVEDRLIEMMRKHYYPLANAEYFPITTHESDYRAKRITDYLNLVQQIVNGQMEQLRKAAFEKGSEIVKYFEMLPDDSLLRQLYLKMTQTESVSERDEIQKRLREQIIPGRIDVNIMTKTDRNVKTKQGEVIENGSEAVAALRGYANSNLEDSSVIFSAGMNPRLYNYLGGCNAFCRKYDGSFSKRVIVKVSDYRSAYIQGKYLAKKGIWVSEFRIESGLNCGGHAFATEGTLLGPILEEFRIKMNDLKNELFAIYSTANIESGRSDNPGIPEMKFSVQGGIGTHQEDRVLREYYHFDTTGWGTPFLLVPEATTVDEHTLDLLRMAKKEDVVLSHHSPLGIRFHYLKGTTAEIEKNERIERGKPGSPCTEKHLAFNTEFTTEPICTASHKYQKFKIAQLRQSSLSKEQLENELTLTLNKDCLCLGLSNAAAKRYDHTFVKNLEAVSICPGPNISNFSRIVDLQTMVDHIYGRIDIITNPDRSHMFITELNLYLDVLEEKLNESIFKEASSPIHKQNASYISNLREGVTYYQNMASSLNMNGFEADLDCSIQRLNEIERKFIVLEQFEVV